MDDKTAAAISSIGIAGRNPPAEARPASLGTAMRRVLMVALIAEYLGSAAWAYRDFYMDDAYIGFRYVANLLAGNGFTFGPGGAVEGVTNIGWLLSLVPFSLIFGPPLAAKLVAVLLIGVTLWLIFAATRSFMPALKSAWRPFAALPALTALLAMTSAEYVTFSMLGMETPLLAAVFAAMLYMAACRANLPALATLGAFAFLVHPEAILVLPLAIAIAYGSRALSARDGGRCLVIFVAWLALITAARWIYFGDVLPNTFVAKSSTVADITTRLIAYAIGAFTNLPFPFSSPLALGLVALGYIAIRRASPLGAAFAAATCLTGLLFSFYATPDWTKSARYFGPYAPAALLLLCAGTLEIERALRRDSAGARAGLGSCIVLIAMVGMPSAMRTFATTSDSVRLAYPGYVMTGQTLVAPAIWMRDNLPADATIATRRIGALAYYGGHRVFDYTFGLTEREVARLTHEHGKHFDDPNDPALATVWRARAPDYLIEDGHVIDRIAAAAGGTRSAFRIHDLPYRVIKTFPVGKDVEWTLAERVSSD